MASLEQYLMGSALSAASLTAGANAFVSSWANKRSATSVGISVVFYGANAPNGTVQLETSNAPDAGGALGSIPANGADDATIFGSTQAVALNSITGLYGYQWQLATCPAHFVRVRFTPGTSVAGLSVRVYAACPYESF